MPLVAPNIGKSSTPDPKYTYPYIPLMTPTDWNLSLNWTFFLVGAWTPGHTVLTHTLVVLS